MKMKKIFVLGLTVLILSFGFISCDTGSGGGANTVPPEYQGIWNSNSGGHKVVVGETSATLTRSGLSPITLPFDGGSANDGYMFGSFQTGTLGNSSYRDIVLQFTLDNPPVLYTVGYWQVNRDGLPVFLQADWTKQP